ncbi:tetratricopeptide repeat protein [Streptomyces virginiae]|uniref:tetratricopeptide repeat protein n=1 Tax=Streptomyces TaxID=1883 RepID=UPI0006ADE9EC|nr:tetratricopeptide repeat protein [Streptomyces sp. H021]KOV31999.1 hypothetical protein ADK97_24145 [Streptomyces sp. H021]
MPFRAGAALIQQWRGHWQDAKLIQRRAQAANRRVRAAARQAHDDAGRDAEALRTEAHAEAERIRTSAHADAEAIRARARRDAEALLDRARETTAATTLGRSEPRLSGSSVVRVGLPTGLGRVPGLRQARAHPEGGTWYAAWSLSDLLAGAGRHEEAVAVLEQHPASTSIVLARHLIDLGRIEDAVRVLQVPPSDAPAPDDPWNDTLEAVQQSREAAQAAHTYPVRFYGHTWNGPTPPRRNCSP